MNAADAAASNSSRPVGLVCEPCQAVGWMYAQYDDRWDTPIPLAQVQVSDINGAVIDSGGRTKGLATFGLEDGIPHQSVRHELGTYAFQAPQEGRLVVELVPEPSGPDPAALEAEIIADLDAFEQRMETALQPWIIAWEDRGVRGLIGSFFSNIRSGASSWWDDQEDLWTAIGNWLSSLPDLAAEAWDGAVAGARELWENRDEILGLIQSLAKGLVSEFQTGFEAILELVSAFPDLEEIANLMREAYEDSAEWAAAMIEIARSTGVLHAIGGTMMGVLAMTPPNFWTDMVALGIGYLVPEIILAIIFAIIAFFSAGMGGTLLAAKLMGFARNVVSKIRTLGATAREVVQVGTETVGTVVAQIIDVLISVKPKVEALVRSLRSRIYERANGATGEATPVLRNAEPKRPTVNASNRPPSRPLVDPSTNVASPQRTQHILHGDATGGGHLWPGGPGKTAFPQDWDANRVMRATSDVATDPNLFWKPQTGNGGLFTKSGKPARFLVTDAAGNLPVVDGVPMRVIVEPAGEGIITSYPKY
ncbi:EndoU domain-containing protein [Tateyamaria sp. ANG-S1]|uniref:EndoU domain-containing protein n=1 Tax=Tateyamaria sp. ANG-S1 TaxID=1577905 RepID=UPI00187C7C02|nr:EndoU domain-containing protein [Tateyamaria sp. ANG-S1]